MENFSQLEKIFYLLIIGAIWTIPWKGLALWRAARNEDRIWFIFLLVVNSFAILEIVYLIFFSKKEKVEASHHKYIR